MKQKNLKKNIMIKHKRSKVVGSILEYKKSGKVRIEFVYGLVLHRIWTDRKELKIAKEGF